MCISLNTSEIEYLPIFLVFFSLVLRNDKDSESYHVLNSAKHPDPWLNALSNLSHLVLIATLLERCYHYPCFKGEENETFRSFAVLNLCKEDFIPEDAALWDLAFQMALKGYLNTWLWNKNGPFKKRQENWEQESLSFAFPIFTGFLIHCNVFTYFIKNLTFLMSIKTLEVLMINAG